MKFDRRTALGFGIATVAAFKMGAARAATAPMRAVISFTTGTYEIREEQGRDMGDFISDIGGFTQRCVRATTAGCPVTVFFRPDRTSDRDEVVFELGQLFSGTPANLGAYNVTIYRGDMMLAEINVPAHYWFSRWRWQSSPRPVVGKVSTLIAQNLLPPYAQTAPATTAQTAVASTSTTTAGSVAKPVAAATAGDVAKPLATVATMATAISAISLTGAASVAYKIMGLAGVTAYMPQTGERADIGLVTEPQGEYICTGSAKALDLLLAQAESAGSCPWHMRDENTGAPIDFTKYTRASWYPDGNPGSPQIKIASNPVKLDSAHMPALAYVPYLLTGDPYYLEELQFQATWNWGAMPPNYRPNIPQARQFAWTIRTLAQCARITPANAPSWLLPQSYWFAFLNTNRQFFEDQYVNSARPERSRFRTCSPIDSGGNNGPTEPAGTWVDPWEDEFVTCVIAWVVKMGFRDWQTAFDWKIGSTIARTNGASGWIRAQATPYRMILRYTATSPIADNWASAFAITKDIQKLTYTDTNTWVPADMTYLTYTRGALAYAVSMGTPGAAACLAWADAQLKAKNWNSFFKWRLVTPT